MPPTHLQINQKRIALAPLLQLIQEGKKLVVIKKIKEETGIGLKEAKDIADSLEAGAYEQWLDSTDQSLSTPEPTSEEHIYINGQALALDPIKELLQEGQLIRAVQEIRRKTGLGLKASKELAEQIAANKYPTNIHTTEAISANNKAAQQFNRVPSSNSSKALTVFLFLLIVALLGYYFAL